jgi:hypothetical protein
MSVRDMCLAARKIEASADASFSFATNFGNYIAFSAECAPKIPRWPEARLAWSRAALITAVFAFRTSAELLYCDLDIKIERLRVSLGMR